MYRDRYTHEHTLLYIYENLMLTVLVTPLHLYMQIGVPFHIFFKNVIAIFKKTKHYFWFLVLLGPTNRLVKQGDITKLYN